MSILSVHSAQAVRTHLSARRNSCTASSTTPGPDDRYRRVRVTHPFHPLADQDFEFIAHRQNSGEDRVHLHDENVCCSRCQQGKPMSCPPVRSWSSRMAGARSPSMACWRWLT
jgi:hypothetical protein